MSQKPLKLTFPRIPVHKRTGDYLRSKTVWLPSSEFLQIGADPPAGLTEARRSFEHASECLRQKKEFFKAQRIHLDAQWKELRELEDGLKTNFIKLSEFIKSNADKRIRATKTIVDDRKLMAQRELEVETLQKKVSFCKQINDDIGNEVRSHMIYQKYLESVVEMSLELTRPDAVVIRYESLVNTRSELGELQAKSFQLLENSKGVMMRKLDENNLQFLGMMNTIARLQSQYRDVHGRCLLWEKVVFNIKTHCFAKYKEITDVQQSCRNIYLLMCRRRLEEPKIPEKNLMKQLVFIKSTLNKLAAMRQEVKERKQMVFSSTKVETSESSN